MRRFSISPATGADLFALRDLARRTFMETYAGAIAAGELEAYVEAAFEPERLLVELTDERCHLFLARVGHEAVGYLKARVPGPGETGVEVERLYVDRAHQGMGTGRRLMERALELAAETDAGHLRVSVWEENDAAIGFYERLGFRRSGSRPFESAGLVHRDWVMVLPVGRPAT